VLADRMGCLKGGVVPNVVVPTPDYMRFAAHYGFRPDFCEANDAAWCGEVNAAVHSELYAVPAERLVNERELLAPLVTARRGRCARASASSSPARSTGSPVSGSARPATRCRCARPRCAAVRAHRGRAADGDRDQYRAASRRTHPRALGEVSNLDAHYGGPRPAPRRVVRRKQWPKNSSSRPPILAPLVGHAVVVAGSSARAT